jgi:hypothetical protein
MFRGLPPGYTKSLERKILRLESILDGIASLPLTAQQIEALKEKVLSQTPGKHDEELSNTLEKYIAPVVDNRSTNAAATSDFPAHLPSPPNSVNGGNPLENTPNGLLSVNENSVITHVGVTNGLHLVTPCEIVDHEIWYEIYISPSDIRRMTSTLCAHRKQTERWTYSRDLDQFILLLPAIEVRQRLIDRFFVDTNPYLIFLNRKLVEDISAACADPSLKSLSELRLPHASTRHRQNERAIMLLLAVIATGINHLEQALPGLDKSIDYKQLTIDLLAQLGDHSTLETVQILLMLTWKEEGCSHPEQAWIHLGNFWFSLLVLICQDTQFAWEFI